MFNLFNRSNQKPKSSPAKNAKVFLTMNDGVDRFENPFYNPRTGQFSSEPTYISIDEATRAKNADNSIVIND